MHILPDLHQLSSPINTIEAIKQCNALSTRIKTEFYLDILCSCSIDEKIYLRKWYEETSSYTHLARSHIIFCLKKGKPVEELKAFELTEEGQKISTLKKVAPLIAKIYSIHQQVISWHQN